MKGWIIAILALTGAALIVVWQLGAGLPGSPPEERAPQAPLETASKATAVGFVLQREPKTLPLVRFEDGDGRTLDLSLFRGRIVLLNLWATWCAPCRREMPTLDRLQQRLGSEDFAVIALSIDRAGDAAVRKFFAEIGVTHLGVYADRSGKALRDFGAVGLPTTLLIDREGREIGRVIGPDEYDTPDWIERIEQFRRTGRG